MARSGPGEEITLLRYATRGTAKHVATGCIDKLDAYMLLITAGRNAGMPHSHVSLLVQAILEVELSRNTAAA